MDKLRGMTIYVTYWSLMDPLCQGQSLSYLKELVGLGYKFALITFEQDKYALEPEQKQQVKAELEAIGIYWRPLKYHKRWSFAATSWDCLCGVLLCIYLCLLFRPQIIHSRASIPAVMAQAVSLLIGVKFLYDADSALSEEYADVGHWSRESLTYRLTSGLERRARRKCDALVVLTEKLKQEYIDDVKPGTQIIVIPCCVNTERFDFDNEARSRIRRKLGIVAEKVMVYAGKVGSWYLVEETFELFKCAWLNDETYRLLILSGDDPDLFHRIAAKKEIKTSIYMVRSVNHDEMPGWLSACDIGTALIRMVPSKRGSSPIKIGEYLSTGLPVVISAGIGDCSDWIGNDALGIIIKEHPYEFEKSTMIINQLLSKDTLLRERCRRAAIEKLDLHKVGVSRYSIVYDSLMTGACH